MLKPLSINPYYNKINYSFISFKGSEQMPAKKELEEDTFSKSRKKVIISPTGKGYSQTDRSIQDLINIKAYPKEFFNPSDLNGKNVLDVGTGGSKFVLDLKKLGANAIGIDIHPHSDYKKYPELFKIADASDTKFSEKSFDRIYSSGSVFTYNEDFSFKVKVLEELKRVLKDDGKIRLGMASPEEIKQIAQKVGGLKISDSFLPLVKYSWVELTKMI